METSAAHEGSEGREFRVGHEQTVSLILKQACYTWKNAFLEHSGPIQKKVLDDVWLPASCSHSLRSRSSIGCTNTLSK